MTTTIYHLQARDRKPFFHLTSSSLWRPITYSPAIWSLPRQVLRCVHMDTVSEFVFAFSCGHIHLTRRVTGSGSGTASGVVVLVVLVVVVLVLLVVLLLIGVVVLVVVVVVVVWSW